MIVVLDTNVFYGDVYAKLMRLSLVLDGAAHGDFEVVVPEIVVQELVHQFPDRVRAAAEEADRGIGKIQKSFGPLGLEAPATIAHDLDGLITAYESAIRQRLSGRHCRIASHPAIAPALDWAVQRRQPFKKSGAGLQDAAIWLTVTSLAAEHMVVLVTENSSDFADQQDPSRLAPDLLSDLKRARIGEGQVRLVRNLDELIKDLVRPLSNADRRGQRLASDPVLSARLSGAVANAVRHSQVDPGDLDYSAELLDWPRILRVEIDPLDVRSISAAEDDRLWLQIETGADVSLSASVDREYVDDMADTLSAEIWPSNAREQSVTIEWETAIWIECSVTTDTEVEEPEVNVRSIRLLEPYERVQRSLDVLGSRDGLGDWLSDLFPRPIRTFLPRDARGTSVDTAELLSFALERVEVEEVLGADGSSILRVLGTGSVHWISTSPSPGAIERYAGETESPTAVLDQVSEGEAIEMLLQGTLTPDGGWDDVSILSVEQAPEAGS